MKFLKILGSIILKTKIKEIYKCLELGLYESALTLTMVLLDMCQMAENNKNNKEQFNYIIQTNNYINWIENNVPIFKSEKDKQTKIF